MPNVIVMEFPTAVAGFGVYPLSTSSATATAPLDFSTGTYRALDVSDDDAIFWDSQEIEAGVGGVDANQVAGSAFTWAGGTIAAGSLLSSGGQSVVTNADNSVELKIGYLKVITSTGAGPNIRELILVEVVSGTFDPSDTYSFVSREPDGGFAYSSSVPCFASGSLIDTDRGPVPVEQLQLDDMVMTRDNGPMPIKWIGSRRISSLEMCANPKLRPVRINAGALGIGFPAIDLCVSPQHRILVKSKVAQRMFGTDEVLIAAIHLVGADGISVDDDCDGATYFHFMLDGHQLVVANGAGAESLFMGTQSVNALSETALAEIASIFPGLASADTFPPVRPFVNGRKGRQLVARHKKNASALVSNNG